jgi:zinc finger protein 830
MANKRKVTQNDLRKLMADMKSGSSASTSTSKVGPKKMKLSSRELALIEDQKRQKAQRDQEKIRLKEERMARVVPNKNLKPQKSILKNSSKISDINYKPPAIYQEIKPKVTISVASDHQPSKPQSVPSQKTLEKEDQVQGEVEDQDRNIPEGFFDDPKLDAKARNVQYVDAGEEEWSKFQKEIADEMIQAQDILVEDRNEATTDRQIEEIDEQIQAWNRVAELEKRKELVQKAARHDNDANYTDKKDDSSDDDVDPDDLTDWRKKC